MKLRFFYVLIMVVSLLASSASGAPMAYSVNSDSQNSLTWDSLYLIDLGASGSDQRQGPLFSGGAFLHVDTEGLAFAPDGTLWGIDDESRILFPIDPDTGSINFLDVIPFPVFPIDGSNDFGMTFTCDNTLYVTSVVTHSLYRLNMDGSSETVGSAGALGVNISAIAAIGNPTRLYGLGNGTYENGAIDSPNLYSIDTDTGVATLVGPLNNADPYNEGGLAFSSDGALWAITDRSSIDNQASQVLSIDIGTGNATPVSYTNETGFESLAIASPTNCAPPVAEKEDDYPRIPALGPTGLLLTIFILMFAGIFFLRKRIS